MPTMPATATLPARRPAIRESMRMAAIDIGSNSIHMIIAEAGVSGGLTTLWRMKEMVGLGRASFPSRVIPREAIDRAVAVMARFQQAAQQRQCEKIVAVATSAVREASNGGDVLERIDRQIGLNVRVINGREEARLIYLGVRHAMPLGGGPGSGGNGGPSLIVDIGGGSVEFIVGDHRRSLLLESRKLGASRMTAAFVKSDPISDDDHAALLNHYNKELTPVCEAILALKPVRAIGTSGTLENLALLCCPKPANGDGKPHVIERPVFTGVLDELMRSSSKERGEMPGLDEGRKDQI